MKTKHIFSSLFLLFLTGTLVAQSAMPLPPQTGTFSGLSRGYWFTAPTSFTITSLRVPTDASSGDQSIMLVKLPAAPPTYASTSPAYTIVALFQNVAGTAAIPVNITVSAGEFIGVIGTRGSAVNSYGTPSPYSTTLLGLPVTLARFGTQNDIGAIGIPPNPPVWTESGGSIGRVEMTVGPVSAVPAVGEWGLIILSLLMLSFSTVFLMRRRMALVENFPMEVSLGSGIPFSWPVFIKMLCIVTVGLVIIFGTGIALLGYELTNADVPGSLIVAPLLAYLLHLALLKDG